MSSDLIIIILAVLAAIGIGVGVTAVVIMLRRSHRATVIYRDAAPEAVEPEPQQPSQDQSSPDPDPISKYLNHLHLHPDCLAVDRLSGQEYLITMGTWCVATTLELARTCDSAADGRNHQPELRIHFTYDDDGAWQISDQGGNAAALHQIGINVPAELGNIRPQVRNLKATLGQDGVTSAQGTSYREFETALADLCKIAIAMDDHFDQSVWDAAGPLPYAFAAAGQQRHFTGHGAGNTDNPTETTDSFTLTTGVMAMSFEQTGTPKREGATGKVQLARDNEGIFDEKLEVFTFDQDHTALAIFRVAEGRWRDPHPDISYHWQVEAFGEWELHMLQPDLGQSRSRFPHRAGHSGGGQIFGPFRTGPHPVRANIRHDGSGEFTLEFISLDGTHEKLYDEYAGQISEVDVPLELLPGKEYLLCGCGTGPWQIEFTEGY